MSRAAANRATRLEALALEECEVGAEGAKARRGKGGFVPFFFCLVVFVFQHFLFDVS